MTGEPEPRDGGYRSRKFILACASFLTSAVFVLLGRLTGDHWLWVLALILGLYGGGNIAAKIVETKRPGGDNG